MAVVREEEDNNKVDMVQETGTLSPPGEEEHQRRIRDRRYRRVYGREVTSLLAVGWRARRQLLLWEARSQELVLKRS